MKSSKGSASTHSNRPTRGSRVKPAQLAKVSSAAVRSRRPASGQKIQAGIADWLQLGVLRSEKCELQEAQIAYVMALKAAKRAGELRAVMEALAGLLRLSRECMDEEAVRKWERELDEMMNAHPGQIPAMAWFCKSGIARNRKKLKLAQRYLHRYIRAVRKNPRNASYGGQVTPEEALAKGWVTMSTLLVERGKLKTATWLVEECMRRWGSRNYRGLNGMSLLLLGGIHERSKRYEKALHYFHLAHAAFLGEHNWYYHLWVLYAYARIARYQQNYAQAYWYLDLVDQAASAPELALIRREIASERSRLEQDAVDLLIDSRRGVIKTRDSEEISLGKQYVLLHILEALSSAHNRPGDDFKRGLSKAEIIQRVWNESYRPEAHDNKLYYNINRLRKLIEPDLRKPQYLLNWKEGYRLAPGLRIQFVGGTPAQRTEPGENQKRGGEQ